MCQPKSKGGKRCNAKLVSDARRTLKAIIKDENLTPLEHTLAINGLAKLKEAEEKYGHFVTPLIIHLSQENKEVLSVLRDIGNPLIIGGFVRDHILDKENKDIDIEVHGANVDEIIAKLKSSGYHVDEVGKSFGVLKAKKPNSIEDYDISVPRLENNVSAGHRGFEVEFDENMTVEDAAARRDFTFNSIMYDDELGVAIDPYHGIKDLKERRLKHVSEAFAEDPLRVLRAFQFAGRFDLTLDKNTASLCQELKSELPTIADERIAIEWEKFYTKSSNPKQSVKVLQDAGWDDMSPGLKNSLHKEQINDGLEYIAQNNIPKATRVSMMAAVIGSEMSASDKAVFYRKTLIGSKAQKLAKTYGVVDNLELSTYSVKKAAAELETNGFNFKDYETYAKALKDDNRLAFVEKAKTAGVYEKSEEPFLKGSEIISLISKRKPGKWVGEMQRELLELQYSENIKDKEEALNWVLAHKD